VQTRLIVIFVLLGIAVACGILYYFYIRSLHSLPNVFLTKEKMRTLMSGMDQRDFDAMFAAVDVDGRGTVEFTEFCVYVGKVSNGDLKSPANEPKKEASAPNKADIHNC
jgi:EF-hand domain pair